MIYLAESQIAVWSWVQTKDSNTLNIRFIWRVWSYNKWGSNSNSSHSSSNSNL